MCWVFFVAHESHGLDSGSFRVFELCEFKLVEHPVVNGLLRLSLFKFAADCRQPVSPQVLPLHRSSQCLVLAACVKHAVLALVAVAWRHI